MPGVLFGRILRRLMINFSALAKETYATIYVQWRARQQGPQLVYLSNTEIGHTDAQKHCQI